MTRSGSSKPPGLLGASQRRPGHCLRLGGASPARRQGRNSLPRGTRRGAFARPQRVRVHETEAFYLQAVVPRARLGLACSGTSVGEERALPRKTSETDSVDERSIGLAAGPDRARVLPPEREAAAQRPSMDMIRMTLAAVAEGRDTKCGDRAGRLSTTLRADVHAPGASPAREISRIRARFECVDDVIGGSRP